MHVHIYTLMHVLKCVSTHTHTCMHTHTHTHIYTHTHMHTHTHTHTTRGEGWVRREEGGKAHSGHKCLKTVGSSVDCIHPP